MEPFAHDLILAYLLCVLSAMYHLCSRELRATRDLWCVAAPPLMYFLGREAEAGWEWRHLIWPSCAVLGFAGAFIALDKCVKERSDCIGDGVPAALVEGNGEAEGMHTAPYHAFDPAAASASADTSPPQPEATLSAVLILAPTEEGENHSST